MALVVRSAFRMTAFCLCFVAACAGARVSNPGSEPRPGPRDFYPLDAGNAWSYDVDTGEASTTLAVTRVETFDGRVAKVQTGETLVRYEVTADGIRVLPVDEWLIRAPIRPGTTWPSPGGRTAELVSTGVAVETFAGRFEGCIEIRELGGELDLEVCTVYCPDVGPVSVTSTMRSNVSERALTVTARLRGFSVGPLGSDR